ncbi:hypothetical protein SI65_04612 [Aspergillus cristatus]|uniref:Gamma interferon inducible lysosomal thiol reductase n=1 Tax=Aspergillus cristatus TaxID=573508 RepID=A0A1E3BFC6_ASPCR|nr:hypothetical protein SI65_04612 [Aspergillus cristatus]
MEKLQSHAYDVPTTDTAVSSQTPRRHRVIAGLGRSLATLLLCFCTYVWINETFPESGSENDFFRSASTGLELQPKLSDNQKVPLEAHVMSKCPDARDCLRQLVVPAMEQVSDLVDFDLNFIASVSNQSSAIECKHGPEECIGDILILCAANLPFPPDAGEVTPDTPRTPTIRSLGFATCLISEYSRIPEREFVEQCALEHGIDFHSLNECASQQEDDPGDGQHPPLSGIALLRKSALHSAELGVTTSCTVRVDDSVWCVRDDGSWKDCGKDEENSKVSSLAEEVKKRYEGKN